MGDQGVLSEREDAVERTVVGGFDRLPGRAGILGAEQGAAFAGEIERASGTAGEAVEVEVVAQDFTALPGGAAIRSATSACTITRISRIDGKFSKKCKTTGTDTL